MTGLPEEQHETHSGTRLFFVSNVLFSSVFFLGLLWMLQSRLGLYGPMIGFTFSGQYVLMMILSLLSFVGATGIFVSLRRLGRMGLWAVPACIVTFSLVVGTLGQVVLLFTPSRTSSFTGFLYTVITSIYLLGLLASAALLFLGYGQSGCVTARITAGILGVFGALSVPFVLQTLSRSIQMLEGIPIRSEEPVVGLLYIVFIMPILGFVIVLQLLYCIHNRKINARPSP